MSTPDNPFGNSAANAPQARFQEEMSSPQTVNLDGNGGGAGALVKDSSTAAFQSDVIAESRRQPVLVDFWAPWCGPCKQLAPMIEKVVAEARGKVKLVKLNIDEHPAIPGQLGIQSIPAVIAFVDGQPVDGFMGAVPESQIRQFIDKLSKGGSDPVQDALEAAKQALDQGQRDHAAQIYSAILQQQPDQPDALAAIAQMLYDAGEKEKAEEMLSRIPAEKQDLPAAASLKARIALDAQVAELGDPVALEAKVENDPTDHEARFNLALVRNAQGRKDEAADHLLAIMKADRQWNEDAARVKLLELFEAWGMTDPATLSARRKLSSLLFS
jgi:putative thioredoxin